ncbi:MAG: rhodanese-like domain-containing protein [Chloroflexi bacterium]|nr:rhodanese-like domain-containing protein [Chloroflexota bacterium]
MFDSHRIPAVDVVEAHDRLATPAAGPGPLLVDVREPSEFAEFRAEGAVLFPLSTFMLRHQSLPRDRELLLICRTGARSGQATAFLLANGWTSVANVEGGTLAWVRAGLPARHGEPSDGEGDFPA